MSATIKSPADVLRQLLIGAALGTMGGKSTGARDWPIFVGHRPDTPNALICVYDTPGTKEGRIQKTGETIHTPGWQIWVRAADYPTGWAKVDAISKFLDMVLRQRVVLSDCDYMVQAVTKTNNPFSLGGDTEGKVRRSEFTLNGTIRYNREQ